MTPAMAKAYLAIIKTPLGVWESTASVCSGHEAEYRARRQAQMKFMEQVLPPFMKTGLMNLTSAYWEAARVNGCECLVQEVEIDAK
jgi:hypothetical protein